MAIRFVPLSPPEIDPRSEEEIVQYACDRIFTSSGGQINDFSPSSPARALIEGQAFAQSEFLFFANKFADRVTVQFLQLCGIMQRLGSAAKANLTFTLTSPLASAFVVPKNYLVTSRSNSNIGFTTDEVLVIPAGSISGTISATATDIGTTFNVAPYTLVNLTQPLAFLKEVTNQSGANGGTNPESDQELRSRAFTSLRRRGLVTRDDYEQEAMNILGEGSTVRAIGNLGADRISKQLGVVHLFCLNPDGTELNSAQINAIRSALLVKSHITVQVYVSNVDLYGVQVKVIAALLPGMNPEMCAIAINGALTEYLKPGTVPLGETIVLKEVEYLVRGAIGVEYVQSVAMGSALEGGETIVSTNLKLPHPYCAATLASLEVELVSEMGSLVYLFGSGDPD